MERFVALLSIAALLGQGCFPLSGTTSGEPSFSLSQEGFTAFRNGFGPIPGPSPLASATSATLPDVSWTADLPLVPNEVTVLRQAPTLPGATLLQNLTTALRIPAGTLQANPRGKTLLASWIDEDGYTWTYDAGTSRLAFERERMNAPLTVSSLPDDQTIVNAALTFLNGRGVSLENWGRPALAFSWNVWWFNESRNGTCMTEGSLNAINGIARTGLAAPAYTPKLPLRSENPGCVQEEFPNAQTVQFTFTKDKLDVYDAEGAPVIAARVVLNVSDSSIVKGWFQVDQDVERSNYPALSQEGLTTQLLLGGTRGFDDIPRGAKIILTTFETGLFAHDTNGDVPRIFYIPSVRASGAATFAGTETPVTIVVPLLRTDQYQNSN